MRHRVMIAAACVAGLAGCQSTDQQLDAQQQQAVQTAVAASPEGSGSRR